MTQSLKFFYKILPQRIKRLISRFQYEYLSKIDRKGSILFMNYGWADLDPDADELLLNENDEPYSYCIQLYHHIASVIDLSGKDILEVGCGRGGGASFIMRYLKPNSLVGADITTNAISFCNQHYDIPGLSFVLDNAESLQFNDNTFDVVINIESSHCYTSMENFLKSVCRVLKHQGYFLFADIRPKNQLERLKQQLEKTGLTLIKEEIITPNIIQALNLDNNRKHELIKQVVPKRLQKPYSEFAGMKGTKTFYGKLLNGDMEYVNYTFHK